VILCVIRVQEDVSRLTLAVVLILAILEAHRGVALVRLVHICLGAQAIVRVTLVLA